MTRILVMTNMFPPHHLGGYELCCLNVIDRWRAWGHDVVVLTSDLKLPGVRDDRSGEAGSVRRELRFYWRDHRLVTPSFVDRLKIERHNQLVLDQTLRTLAPEVVSVWHMGAMSLGLLSTLVSRGVPSIYVVHDDWLLYATELDAWMRWFRRVPGRWIAPVVRRLSRLPVSPPSIGNSGTFCFASEFIRTNAMSSSLGKPQRSLVVYPGIDRTMFHNGSAERPWRWRLLYAGRVESRKGVDVAVRALGKLPASATLDIVGRGEDSYIAELESIAVGAGVRDRISFNVTDRDGLREIYSSSDVLLFPVRWEEPFGLVPLEAMACGTPVVATATGGSAEFLVDGENCLTVPRDDHGALAAAVTRLSREAPLRGRLVNAGFAMVPHFDIAETARLLEQHHVAAAAGSLESD